MLKRALNIAPIFVLTIYNNHVAQLSEHIETLGPRRHVVCIMNRIYSIRYKQFTNNKLGMSNFLQIHEAFAYMSSV